jgi:hypothetical protein
MTYGLERTGETTVLEAAGEAERLGRVSENGVPGLQS